MSRKVVSIANRQRLDVAVGGPKGANRLLIYTGTAVLDEWFAVENRLVRDEVDIILGSHSIGDPNIGDNFSGSPFSPIHGVASVALATITDLGDSENVTWAIDEATIEEVFIDPVTRFLKIHCTIAYQGEAAGLLRLSYHADVLAIAAEEEVQLQSFTLAPNRISTGLADRTTGVSRGTVTLDRPAAAGGTVVKIAAQSLVPNIVSFPPDITISAGQSSAIFDVAAALDTFSIEDVVIMASYGPRALAAKLTVVGSPR